MIIKITALIIISVLVTLFFIYLQKRKTVCPNCKSSNVAPTGKKIYKEDPIGAFGSPDSYHQTEYKCTNCGHTFMVKNRAVIFN